MHRDALTVSRKEFLLAAGALLSSVGCAAVTTRAGLARVAFDDPSPREVRDMMLHVVRAVLPFEHPSFPEKAPGEVRDRLIGLFPLDDGDFAAFRRGLRLFDAAHLFDAATPKIVTAEERATISRPDGSSYADFARQHGTHGKRFSEMTVDAQRAYMELWMRSDLVLRRRFARGAKSLVMITAYTSERLWTVLGYAGPLIERRHAPG